LNTVLKINDSNFELFIKDRESIENQISNIYCFETTKETKIKTTLVWNDPPSLPSTSKLLINNLDLKLICNNVLFRGNDMIDDVNNVEQSSCDLKFSFYSFLI
jgi:hypothetical protein